MDDSIKIFSVLKIFLKTLNLDYEYNKLNYIK